MKNLLPVLAFFCAIAFAALAAPLASATDTTAAATSAGNTADHPWFFELTPLEGWTGYADKDGWQDLDQNGYLIADGEDITFILNSATKEKMEDIRAGGSTGVSQQLYASAGTFWVREKPGVPGQVQWDITNSPDTPSRTPLYRAQFPVSGKGLRMASATNITDLRAESVDLDGRVNKLENKSADVVWVDVLGGEAEIQSVNDELEPVSVPLDGYNVEDFLGRVVVAGGSAGSFSYLVTTWISQIGSGADDNKTFWLYRNGRAYYKMKMYKEDGGLKMDIIYSRSGGQYDSWLKINRVQFQVLKTARQDRNVRVEAAARAAAQNERITTLEEGEEWVKTVGEGAAAAAVSDGAAESIIPLDGFSPDDLQEVEVVLSERTGEVIVTLRGSFDDVNYHAFLWHRHLTIWRDEEQLKFDIFYNSGPVLLSVKISSFRFKVKAREKAKDNAAAIAALATRLEAAETALKAHAADISVNKDAALTTNAEAIRLAQISISVNLGKITVNEAEIRVNKSAALTTNAEAIRLAQMSISVNLDKITVNEGEIGVNKAAALTTNAEAIRMAQISISVNLGKITVNEAEIRVNKAAALTTNANSILDNADDIADNEDAIIAVERAITASASVGSWETIFPNATHTLDETSADDSDDSYFLGDLSEYARIRFTAAEYGFRGTASADIYTLPPVVISLTDLKAGHGAYFPFAHQRSATESIRASSLFVKWKQGSVDSTDELFCAECSKVGSLIPKIYKIEGFKPAAIQ